MLALTELANVIMVAEIVVGSGVTMKVKICNCDASPTVVSMYIMDACFYGMSNWYLSYEYCTLLVLQSNTQPCWRIWIKEFQTDAG